jgi:hypothetical protein
MTHKIPGLTTIVLIVAATCVAANRLFAASVILGAAYCLIFAVTMLCLLFFYCRKCPHVAEGTCRHTVIGPLVKKLFKTMPPAPYSPIEMLFAFTPGVLFVLFPQYGLFKNIHSLVIFWTLMVIAVIIIGMGVCPTCGNVHCFFCRRRKEGIKTE